MKNIFLISVLFFMTVSSLCAQKTPLSSEEIMKEAFTSPKNQNKKVLVMFHASWYGWFHKMDTSLNDALVKKFFDDNFVIRHLVVFESKGKENFENPGALDCLQNMKARIRAFHSG